MAIQVILLASVCAFLYKTLRSSTLAPLLTIAAKYDDFPKFRAPQVFINAISQSLPIFLLILLFDEHAAGFYTLSRMVMGMPSSLLGKAFSDVFYPKITQSAHNHKNISKQIMKWTVLLFLLAIIPFGIVMLWGPVIFTYMFGDEWEIAGEYSRWLSLFFLFNFANKATVAAVPVLNIQRGLLVYEVFSTSIKTIGLFIGFYYFDSDIWAVALFSIMGVIAYALMMIWIIYEASRWDKYEKAS